MASTASKSNPPLFLALFGLSPWLPPLQRPIRRFFSLLLDFFRGFHRFNVQSTSLSHPFWTSACLPATSTSNPPLFLTPFGLLPWLPPLQRPIRHIFLLSFYIYIRNALSKSLTLHPYLPQSSQRHTRQKTPAGTSPAGAFEKHTNY